MTKIHVEKNTKKSKMEANIYENVEDLQIYETVAEELESQVNTLPTP